MPPAWPGLPSSGTAWPLLAEETPWVLHVFFRGAGEPLLLESSPAGKSYFAWMSPGCSGSFSGAVCPLDVKPLLQKGCSSSQGRLQPQMTCREQNGI